MSGLTARGVSVAVGEKLIVDGVDCTVAKGSLTALVGPNGAGKSTLLHALAGVTSARSREITFGATDLVATPRRERARIVALLEQDAVTDTAMSVDSVVALGRMPHESFWRGAPSKASEAVLTAITQASISHLVDRQFATLSGGERQRVMLARALAQEPQLLLLDEPTNHLDIGAQLSVLTLLHELTGSGMTIVTALHDLVLAATFADHVIVLMAGKVVAAGPTPATLTPELIRTVYGVTATVIDHPVTGRPLIAFSELG